MYPPIFRDRKRAALNLASLDEVAALLRRGGFFVGVHPEGTRKKDDDPYTFLPAQSGVGRIIRKARGPGDPRLRQRARSTTSPRRSAAGITGRAPRSTWSSAPPSTSAPCSTAPDSPATHKRIAEAALGAIRALGEEEKALRRRSP